VSPRSRFGRTGRLQHHSLIVDYKWWEMSFAIRDFTDLKLLPQASRPSSPSWRWTWVKVIQARGGTGSTKPSAWCAGTGRLGSTTGCRAVTDVGGSLSAVWGGRWTMCARVRVGAWWMLPGATSVSRVGLPSVYECTWIGTVSFYDHYIIGLIIPFSYANVF